MITSTVLTPSRATMTHPTASSVPLTTDPSRSAPADAGGVRHAGDCVELISDDPVLKGAQVTQGLALPLHGVPEHVAKTGRIGPEGRHRARRQRLAEELEPLEHARAREVEIDV